MLRFVATFSRMYSDLALPRRSVVLIIYWSRLVTTTLHHGHIDAGLRCWHFKRAYITSDRGHLARQMSHSDGQTHPAGLLMDQFHLHKCQELMARHSRTEYIIRDEFYVKKTQMHSKERSYVLLADKLVSVLSC